MPDAPLDLISAQRSAMLAVFRAAGMTRASYLLELAAVSRAAAAEGEYAPAMKGYELLGKTLGVLGAENHLHLHGGGSSGDGVSALAQATRMAQLSDAQLAELAGLREAREVEVIVAPPEPEAPAVSEAVPEAVPADDPLFR